MNSATNLNHPVVSHPAPRAQANSGNNNNNSNTSSNSIANASNAGCSGNATTSATQTTNSNTSTSNNNGSLSDSLASTDGHRTPNVEHLSKTNLYIRGLQANTNDQDLYNMCARFGQISSTKAILDKSTGCCRGYGFVEFTTPQAAELAVQELTKSGIQAQMAKISPLYHHSSSSSSHHNQQHHHQQQHHHHHNNNNNNNGNTGHGSGSQHNHQNSSSSHNNNADPTNLYIANLPPNMSELELESLLSTYGPVVSTRILRDQSNIPRGVGFARMETRDKCEQIIEQLNGRPCKGWKEPLLVKFADGGNKKRHHHINHHQHQHQHHSGSSTNNSSSSSNNNNNNNNNNNHQHHKVHQDDSRWRDSSNASDLGSVTSFDRQGNISHSNHLSDLAMMSTMSYPRIQTGFPPPVAPGAAYPAQLGPPTSAPQWIHPGSPGQPYVIPQQMIQTGGLGPSNQAAAAAAALHYGHIPQLASQMQGLQIAHAGAPVGGYLPPQHQWSAMWAHTIPQQPSMRLPAPMQPPPQSQQQQQQQQSPQSTPLLQQQPSNQQQQPPATDNKLQISMPL